MVAAGPADSKSKWRAAILAWNRAGAAIVYKNGKDAQAAGDVRVIHFFRGNAAAVKSLSHLRRLPNAKAVRLQIDLFDVSQSRKLASNAKLLRSLKEVRISIGPDGKTRVTDADVCHLSKIPNLTLLSASSLQGFRVTDAGLKCLGRSRNIEVLVLNSGKRMAVTDEGLV